MGFIENVDPQPGRTGVAGYTTVVGMDLEETPAAVVRQSAGTPLSTSLRNKSAD
jgi:hypothetical protein